MEMQRAVTSTFLVTAMVKVSRWYLVTAEVPFTDEKFMSKTLQKSFLSEKNKDHLIDYPSKVPNLKICFAVKDSKIRKYANRQIHRLNCSVIILILTFLLNTICSFLPLCGFSCCVPIFSTYSETSQVISQQMVQLDPVLAWSEVIHQLSIIPSEETVGSQHITESYRKSPSLNCTQMNRSSNSEIHNTCYMQ